MIILFCVVMFAVFTALKIADVINWSWLAVTSPIWIPFLLFVFLVIIRWVRESLDEWFDK